jgi:hypothetical protein
MKSLRALHSNSVWPPALLVAVFAVPYAMIATGLWLIERATPGMDGSEEIKPIRTIILGLASGLYALFRLWRFHPACNPAYRLWLRLSPWTAGKPLPAGPVHPVWQDAAVIGMLTAVACLHPRVDPTLPVTAFGSVYLVGLTLLLAATRQWWHWLALGFLWPSLVLPAAAGSPTVVIVALMVAVIWHGHSQSMRAFPWEGVKCPDLSAAAIAQADIRIEPVTGAAAAGTRFNLGWPFMALSPKARPSSVSLRRTVAIGSLFGWWSYCIIKSSAMEAIPELILVLAVVGAFIRVGVYGSGTTAPFNIWGRIATGRIIVPGFDRVFLTPLATVGVGILSVILVKRSGAWYPEAEAIAIAVIWYVLLGGGPTLRNWVLTGQLRLRPLSGANARKQMVRPV